MNQAKQKKFDLEKNASTILDQSIVKFQAMAMEDAKRLDPAKVRKITYIMHDASHKMTVLQAAHQELLEVMAEVR